MATKGNSDTLAIPDGSFDWSAGVDSTRVTTLQSTLNPNGLPRNALSWMNNATVRNGGIIQMFGWQPLLKVSSLGHWQGGFIYEPDSALPYMVCSISGHIYKVLLDPPYTVTELFNTIVAPWVAFGVNNINLDNPPFAVSLNNPQFNPDTERVWFVQGENYLVIQAGDYFTTSPATLPLIWDGTTLRRSLGINTATPSGYVPHVNEIPAATAMDYYSGRIWYAQARQYSAGDMVGGPSGTVGAHYRDSIINVTENPLVLGGDGFTVPTNAGNIRAIKHSANLNAALGEGQLFIFTRKTIYSLTVPTTRTDWINASSQNQPLQTVVQLVNGTTGDRSVVAVNGDLFYQAFDPSIRSLMVSVRNFGQWGNTPISQNENRALALNDRALMRFSGGIEFDNRLLQLVLPKVAADGVNVIHQAIIPLDFDVVSNLNTQLANSNSPVWEGAQDGLQFLELHSGDFGGLPRAFGSVISDVDGSINIWELTNYSRTWNGDNRVTWAAEFPAFTWSASGLELKLKQLNGGEMWVDKVFGTVDLDVYFREDADPCWRFWMHTSVCQARNCQEQEPVGLCYPYPQPNFREGYRFPIVFPEPHPACDSLGIRPTTIGYQFQVKVVIKGWCRIRGILLYAIPREKAQFQGVACPDVPAQLQGMAKLPNPFA